MTDSVDAYIASGVVRAGAVYCDSAAAAAVIADAAAAAVAEAPVAVTAAAADSIDVISVAAALHAVAAPYACNALFSNDRNILLPPAPACPSLKTIVTSWC